MQHFGNPRKCNGIFPQILAVFTSTLSAISDGMQYGWSAPVIPILMSDETPVLIQKSDIVWLENIYMIGAFIGLPFTIYVVDRVGRKNSVLFAAVVNLLAWILIATAKSVEMLYIGRFIAGFASDVAFLSIPMYIAEIADHRIRGFLGSFIYLMMLVGILIIYAVAPFVSVMISSIVGASFLILQIVSFSFMPKSPYYLLLKDKREEALKSLQWLRSTDNVKEELLEIISAIERQNSEKGRLTDLITVKSNRKALLITIVVCGIQHFSGISVMLMNIHVILGNSAFGFSSNVTAIIFSIIMLVSATIAALLIDKAGRKILLSSSAFLTSLTLLVLASYFAIKHSGVDTSSYSWVPVASIMIYAAVFKYGLGLVPIVLNGELFPTSIKAIGMEIGDVAYVGCSVISIYLYQYLAETYGMHVPFFVFAISCFLTALFVVYYVPETKGKTLEEIQFMLKRETLNKNKSESTEAITDTKL